MDSGQPDLTVVVPCYNEAWRLAHFFELIRANPQLNWEWVFVDDGSTDQTSDRVQAFLETVPAEIRLLAHPTNHGKGAAVRTGFQLAEAMNFTHALQIDADDQHNADDIPRFLEVAQQRHEALIIGDPIFDYTVPPSRLFGRKITQFWIGVETRGKFTGDALCGFRVYPLAQAVASKSTADRMAFDIEILVRTLWRGIEVRTLPTRVRYIPREQGGVSHFRYFRDNFAISLLHFRLVCLGIINYFR